jgi:hypothetical protein
MAYFKVEKSANSICLQALLVDIVAQEYTAGL